VAKDRIEGWIWGCRDWWGGRGDGCIEAEAGED
jgi:hypothetical protein